MSGLRPTGLSVEPSSRYLAVDGRDRRPTDGAQQGRLAGAAGSDHAQAVARLQVERRAARIGLLAAGARATISEVSGQLGRGARESFSRGASALEFAIEQGLSSRPERLACGFWKPRQWAIASSTGAGRARHQDRTRR